VSRFVLDASVVLSWCFPDENSALARHVADRFKQGDIAVAASFWPHEVLNALLAGEKRKRISGEMIQSFLDDLALLPVTLEGTLWGDLRGANGGVKTFGAAYQHGVSLPAWASACEEHVKL